jgi:CBS domain-containing protein
MKVADILRIKGSVVKTVAPHETALLLSGHLRAEQIGALVVSTDGNSIDGIVSERDLAYGLATHGARLPTIPISELMTKAVVVCSPEDSVTDVMKLMAAHSPCACQGRRPTRRDHQHRRCSQAPTWRVASGSKRTSGLCSGCSPLEPRLTERAVLREPGALDDRRGALPS